MNSREGCGITPFSLPVLHKNTTICKFRVESGARYSGLLFPSIHFPWCRAGSLQHAEILEIFSVDQDESKDEKELIRLVDSTFSKGSSNGGHKG